MKKLTIILFSIFLLCGCGKDCTDDAVCPLPIEQPEATATVLPTPSPSPKPTPEPTPTPIPLLPAELIDYSIPEAVFGEAQHQGWVTEMEYITRDYVSGSEEEIVKSMDVYRPYNYDPEGQYDVLFLMHIAGGDEGFWFGSDFYYHSPEGNHRGIYLFDMLDKMIEQGRCAPLIVISLDGFLYDENRWTHSTGHSYEQFHHEFANDIMPYVVENLATYAEGSSREEMSKAREHFGFTGASYGSYLNNNCILKHCFDLVANFGFSGGGAMNYDVLKENWQRMGVEDMPVESLYIAVGLLDNRGPPEQAYLTFKADTERFNEDNLHLSLFTDTGHDQREWINSVYNSLQLFYR